MKPGEAKWEQMGTSGTQLHQVEQVIPSETKWSPVSPSGTQKRPTRPSENNWNWAKKKDNWFVRNPSESNWDQARALPQPPTCYPASAGPIGRYTKTSGFVSMYIHMPQSPKIPDPQIRNLKLWDLAGLVLRRCDHWDHPRHPEEHYSEQFNNTLWLYLSYIQIYIYICIYIHICIYIYIFR